MTDSWNDLLAPNEEIFWHGAPRSRVRLEWKDPLTPLFYLFFTGFSLFWMATASQNGGLFWMFGLIFFLIGTYGLAGIHFWQAFVRRHQYYTLTNQRAIIATMIFGRRSLRSYPIAWNTEIDFQDFGETGDIYFAHEESWVDNSMTTIKIGFEQIENPRQVLAEMRRVQSSG